MNATFRGRGLNGIVRKLPEGYKGKLSSFSILIRVRVGVLIVDHITGFVYSDAQRMSADLSKQITNDEDVPGGQMYKAQGTFDTLTLWEHDLKISKDNEHLSDVLNVFHYLDMAKDVSLYFLIMLMLEECCSFNVS